MKLSFMKQKGVIVFGEDWNQRAWINAAKAQGYVVVLCGYFCELWS